MRLPETKMSTNFKFRVIHRWFLIYAAFLLFARSSLTSKLIFVGGDVFRFMLRSIVIMCIVLPGHILAAGPDFCLFLSFTWFQRHKHLFPSLRCLIRAKWKEFGRYVSPLFNPNRKWKRKGVFPQLTQHLRKKHISAKLEMKTKTGGH